MNPFYKLNQTLNSIGAEKKQITESKQVAPKSPVQQTLEQALRTDLKNLMEDGTGGANFSGPGSLEEKSTGDYSAKKAAAGKDIGKPGKQFSKIAKSAGEKYGSKERGEKVAGAVLKKLRGGESKEMECDTPTPSKGIPGNIPVPGKMDRLKGKRDYYETQDDSEEDIMDYLNRKLEPHDKEQAKEDAVSKPYNGPANAADAYNGMEFEGNAFTGKLKSTPKGGKFKLGDKEFTDTSELDETMTRQHFQHTADLLKHIEDPAKRMELARHHAGVFKASNPRFDHAKFMKACGVTDEGIVGQAAGSIAGGAVGGPIGAAIGGAIGNNLTSEAEMDEGFEEMDAWLKSREKEKGTGKFDKRKVSTGTVYTRKPETFDEPEASDEPDTDGVKRGCGRPAGTKLATGAKHSGRSKLASKAAIAEEGEDKVCEQCGHPISEKSVSQAQAHLMAAAAHNPKFAKKVGMKQTVAKEFNKADKGKDISKLPKKVKKTEEGAKPDFLDVDKDGDKKETFKKAVDDKKKKKVKETTTSGSIAPATLSQGKPKTSNADGVSYGKGIYDSFNRSVEAMISESVKVTSRIAEHAVDGDEEAITVTATGADVHRIKELLAAMGIEHDVEHAHGEEPCGTCGGVPCQCDELGHGEAGLPGDIEIELDEADAPVDENEPDYPTNQEESDDALQYSGGLNGPKSTGQTTIPVIASQEERQMSEGRSLYDLFKAIEVRTK